MFCSNDLHKMTRTISIYLLVQFPNIKYQNIHLFSLNLLEKKVNKIYNSIFVYFNNTNYFVIDVILSNCKFCHFCHKLTSLSHFSMIDKEPLSQASCWNAVHSVQKLSGGLGYHIFIECEFLFVRVHIVRRTEELTAAPKRHLFFIVK